MTKIAYVRVSTQDQHPEAQEARLLAAGCEKVFTDHGVSGRLASRPGWDECLRYLRKGDVLMVVKLDRIGRSLRNLLEVVSDLEEREVDLVVLDQAIDTTTASGRLIFMITAAICEWEAALIRERTMDGLSAARARGRVGGRRRVLSATQVSMARQMYASQEFTVAAIAETFKCSRPTIYRALGGSA